MKSRALAVSLVAISLLVSSPSTTLAKQPPQSTGESSAVAAVSAGEKLVVKMKSGKESQGNLSTVSDTQIVLSDGSKVIEIDRNNVQQIYLAPRSVAKSAGRATLMGTAIGLWGRSCHGHGSR
jgi:hypothetical protein